MLLPFYILKGNILLFKRLCLTTLLFITSSSVAFAGIVINSTRVIYPSDEKEVTAKVLNKGERPVLIQSWIDEGSIDKNPSDIKVPFVLTPPINRVDPEKGQTLRIRYVGGEELPKDRESLFWLNVLEIPAKSENIESRNKVQVAFRTRIKILYRPNNLMLDINDASNALSWERVENGIVINNTTPYYFSISKVFTNNKNEFIPGEMIPPKSDKLFKLSTDNIKGNNLKIEYINDYGALVTSKVNLKY